MEKALVFVSENTMLVLVIGLVLLIGIFFIFRRLLKILLVVMLIALAFWGYQYFKGPDAGSQGLAASFKAVVDKTVETGEKMRQIYRDTGHWLDRNVVFFRELLGTPEAGGNPGEKPDKGQIPGK